MSQPQHSEREEDKNRFVIFPGKHEDIWDCYKSLQENFWTPEEIDWNQDEKDQQKLSGRDSKSLSEILSTVVLLNQSISRQIVTILGNEPVLAESRFYFSQELSVLNSQSESLSLVLKSLNCTAANIDISDFPTVKWLEKKFTSASYPETLILICIAESLFYSQFFRQTLTFKQKELMPGLVFSSDLISRDKTLQINCLLKILKKQDKQVFSIEKTETLLMEAFELEKSTSANYTKETTKSLAACTFTLLERFQEIRGKFITTGNQSLTQKRIETLKEAKKDTNISRKTGF